MRNWSPICPASSLDLELKVSSHPCFPYILPPPSRHDIGKVGRTRPGWGEDHGKYPVRVPGQLLQDGQGEGQGLSRPGMSDPEDGVVRAGEDRRDAAGLDRRGARDAFGKGRRGERSNLQLFLMVHGCLAKPFMPISNVPLTHPPPPAVARSTRRDPARRKTSWRTGWDGRSPGTGSHLRH